MAATPEGRVHPDAVTAVAVLAGPAVAVAWHALQGAAGLPSPAVPPLWWGLLVAPVVEELAFRGAVMHWLARLRPRGTSPVSFANAGASVLFSIAHLPTHGPLGAAAVFLPSLVLGWTAERHRSLWPAVALHAWFNASFLAGAWLLRP